MKIAITGDNTTNCGGVVGWAEERTNIVNCLVVSNASTFNYADASNGHSSNIARAESNTLAVDLETYNADPYANRPGGACYNNYVTVDWGGTNPATTVVPLEDLADGETSLEKACESYNYMVDSANYRRATAPVSKSAILKAQEFIEKNGFEESFIRRCATIEDIQADLVLFSNQTETQTKTKVSIFDGLKPTTVAKTNNMAKGFDKLEKVPVDAFMADFLPRCESVEVYLDNIHKNNFMTLLTSNNKDSKRIFKWMNNFSWSYVGGNAGKSMIKTAVKQAGGNVEAPFRFSIMWNEDWETNPVTVDFDLLNSLPKG